MSHHIISYHITYHITCHHIRSHIISYHITSDHITACYIIVYITLTTNHSMVYNSAHYTHNNSLYDSTTNQPSYLKSPLVCSALSNCRNKSYHYLFSATISIRIWRIQKGLSRSGIETKSFVVNSISMHPILFLTCNIIENQVLVNINNLSNGKVLRVYEEVQKMQQPKRSLIYVYYTLFTSHLISSTLFLLFPPLFIISHLISVLYFSSLHSTPLHSTPLHCTHHFSLLSTSLLYSFLLMSSPLIFSLHSSLLLHP